MAISAAAVAKAAAALSDGKARKIVGKVWGMRTKTWTTI